jgi:hypothetical protein
MSVQDYQEAKWLADTAPSLTSLLMAAMLRAEGVDEAILRSHFRDTYDEVRTRIDCPRGLMAGERDSEGWFRDEDGKLYDADGEPVEPQDEPD